MTSAIYTANGTSQLTTVENFEGEGVIEVAVSRL